MDIEKRIEALESRVAELERNRTGKRFIPPTVDEVRAHCREKGYSFDVESFVAFYESNGWRVGKSKMKSWKSACITWAKREQINGQSRSDRQQRISEQRNVTRDYTQAVDF